MFDNLSNMNMQPNTTQSAPLGNEFVNDRELLRRLFPHEESRPCLRTLKNWQKRKMIPWSKIGRMCYFQPAKVQAALEKKFSIESR
jgi:hypothetical protein